jgi:hypothetical protein
MQAATPPHCAPWGREKFFQTLKNLRNSKFLYLGWEYRGDHPAASATDTTNDRVRMSSPGGEETGEGGQFFAPGAHILTRGRILPHTRDPIHPPQNVGVSFNSEINDSGMVIFCHTPNQ